MKPKTFIKKFTLNKETVTNLNNDALVKIKGGIWTIQYTCDLMGEGCNSFDTCGGATHCEECTITHSPSCAGC
jgi:hypothetical protein